MCMFIIPCSSPLAGPRVGGPTLYAHGICGISLISGSRPATRFQADGMVQPSDGRDFYEWLIQGGELHGSGAVTEG
ncbi:MAG: hypothetical protein F9K15_20205 [Zoogloea sp.]|nr:MAG: hypothetical protein F9K15_20205 [Zoogloea sp.]